MVDNNSKGLQLDVDVIVVGAGVAGLTAAFTLLQRDPGLRVAVVEANDRVGGRTTGRTLKSANGLDTWDLGGQWVGSCQTDVMSLLAELQLSTYAQYTNGVKLMQLTNDGQIARYSSEIPALSLFGLIDLHFFMTRIDGMRKKVNISDPGMCAVASEWDSMTLEQFKQKHLWTAGAKSSVDAAVRCVFGTEAANISLLYFLAYVAAAGGLEPLLSCRRQFGGQELRVTDGAWKISTRLAELIGEKTIHLNTAITKICQDKGPDSVFVETSTGRTLKCKRVIMAVPPSRAVDIIYQPKLPVVKQNVWYRMPAGNITKVIVTYKTAFWRTAGLSGEAVTVGGKSIITGCEEGPLCVVFDATTSQESPALVSFIAGRQHVCYSSVTADERQRAVLHSLSELFGPEALNPLDYCEKNWNEEWYCNGGPVSIAAPGIMLYAASALRQPFDRIHLAGTETATRWCGFINGAVQSGRRAAMEVLYNLRPQTVTASDLVDTIYGISQSRRCSPSSARQWNRRVDQTVWRPVVVGVITCVTIFYLGRRLLLSKK